MTVGDLKRTMPTYKNVPNLALLCPVCGETYSATPSDYFMAADSVRMTCENGHGAELLQLVQKETRYRRIKIVRNGKPSMEGGARGCYLIDALAEFAESCGFVINDDDPANPLPESLSEYEFASEND